MVVDFPRTTVAERCGTSLRRRRFRDARELVRRRRTVPVAPGSSSRRPAISSSSPTRAIATTCSRCGPKPKQAVVDPTKRDYKGERLTLNFQDIETRAVLQLLAETSGQNIVVSDTVQGNVTLRLQNVPWDQALDIVLRTKGLDKRQEGNVIYVAPSEELAAREKQQLEANKAHDRAGAGAHGIPAGQLRQGVGPGRPDQIAGQELAAVRPRQRLDRRAHQHACCCRTRPIAWPTSAGSCRRSTSRCARC